MFKDLKVNVGGAIEAVMEIAEIIMFLVGFKQIKEAKEGTERKEAVRQHLPHLFGFGRADEGIWGSLRTALDKEHRVALDKIMKKLPAEEAISFILTVSLMPNDIAVNEKGDEVTIAEFSKDDRRVKFLKDLFEDANMCATETDVDEAIAVLRANRLTSEDKLTELQKSVKKCVFDFFDITSWSELNSNHVANKLNEATDVVEAFRLKRRKSLFNFSGARDFLSDLLKKFKLKGV